MTYPWISNSQSSDVWGSLRDQWIIHMYLCIFYSINNRIIRYVLKVCLFLDQWFHGYKTYFVFGIMIFRSRGDFCLFEHTEDIICNTYFNCQLAVPTGPWGFKSRHRQYELFVSQTFVLMVRHNKSRASHYFQVIL